jgi:hypothetical protein
MQNMASVWRTNGVREHTVSGTVYQFLGTAVGTKRALQAQAMDHLLGPGRLAERATSIHRSPQRRQLHLRLRRVDHVDPTGLPSQRLGGPECLLLRAALRPAMEAPSRPLFRAPDEIRPQGVPLHVAADRPEMLVVLDGERLKRGPFLGTLMHPLTPSPRQRSRHVEMLSLWESATSDTSHARPLPRLTPLAPATSAAASANSTRRRWADSHVR